jgi:hypothetical protein
MNTSRKAGPDSKEPSLPSPKQVAETIRANVRNLDLGIVTFAEFGKRNRSAWDSILRGELPVIGSACSRRMQAVHLALKAGDAQ